MTPSLQDIARMPLPASIEAMRRHYNPDWARDEWPPVETENLFGRYIPAHAEAANAS